MMDCQKTNVCQMPRGCGRGAARAAFSPRDRSRGAFIGWPATILLLVLCGGGRTGALALEDPSAGVECLVGSRVDITLRSGKVLRGVTIVEVRPGDVHGTVATLRVLDPAKQLRSVLGASAIQRVVTADGTVCLAFDKKSKTLSPPDPEKLAEIRRAASAGPSGSAEPAAASKAGDDAARRKEKEAKRQEFFKKTGVMPWAELSDKEQKAEIEKQKEFLKKVAGHFPALNMRLSETKYFLLLSSLPPAQTAGCEPNLDTMHKELCQAYAIENPDKLWLGKGVVVLFTRHEDFMQFEQVFFHVNPPANVQGANNNNGRGEVVVGCYCGDDAAYSAGVLVHEATHGFNHRYKSPRHLPNWLDEGIADYVAMGVVKKNVRAKQRVQKSVAQARQQGNLGGDFFTAEHIGAWQYGIAASMVNFLLKTHRKSFREMIDYIKAGATWQDALKRAYGFTPEELTKQYGKSIGVPALVP